MLRTEIRGLLQLSGILTKLVCGYCDWGLEESWFLYLQDAVTPCGFLFPQVFINMSLESKLEVTQSESLAGELKMTHLTGWWPIPGTQIGVTTVGVCSVLIGLILHIDCFS